MINRIKNHRNKLPLNFFQLACILTSFVILLCGCTSNEPALDSDLSVPTQNSSAPTQDSSAPAEDPLTPVRKWLETDFSFSLSYQYTNLAVNGMSQQTTQTFAKDGSWSMVTQRKMWDHGADYEMLENAEFYYRYEDSNLICYSRMDEKEPQRIELTNRDEKELNESKDYLVGCSALLPDYLQDLTVTQVGDETVFSYKLSVENLLEDSTILSVFLNNMFTLHGIAYESEYNAFILCSFVTDAQSSHPKSVTYDFSQIKPYVLSSGAQSGEYAFDTDFITMTFSFDYNLADTTQIPEYMIP